MAFVDVRSPSSGQAGFRWAGQQGGPDAGMFPGLVRREFGRGEFRGLEFYEVEARRIINEVPAVSRVPFRFTINAYRGCSHACSYCAHGDTPVLMADGRTKPIRNVTKGDHIYGTRIEGRYRRYTVTEVIDHWQTFRRAWRVTLEDSTELLVSGDHRLLSDRGWKHVTDAEPGAPQRSHLTTNNRLLGVGRFAEPPKGGPEYRAGYLCGLIRGDAHVGHFTYDRPDRGPSTVHRFRLALADDEALWRAEQWLADVGVLVTRFQFSAAGAARREMRAIRSSSAANVAAVERLCEWPRDPSDEWLKGFLAGIFDAEGSCSQGVWRLPNSDLEIIHYVLKGLRRYGFHWTLEHTHHEIHRDLTTVRLLGGLAERLRFFHTVDPAIRRKASIEGSALKGSKNLGVVAVEPLGVEMPMYDITTGTGDYIADGVVHHNCFARPTHEYLNFNIADDFERKLVVKVNAVERLRAELRPSRWAGEHIAMGTNTDPYQRAEGKYRLTRGVVEVLSEHRNPFSILTKSSLILRDLDLLAEAAHRTEVAANFSIGTLDEDVWRLAEPGTPHPRKRVEAVAKLNEAGVRCGVLVAPILPGLSDSEAQIDAVVGACIEAGARSISAITLHLRRGVREHYLSWIEEHRPDLVPLYRDLYGRRAYAPKRFQARVAARVARAVERHGGLPATAGEARRVPAPPAPPEDEPAEQLGLAFGA